MLVPGKLFSYSAEYQNSFYKNTKSDIKIDWERIFGNINSTFN